MVGGMGSGRQNLQDGIVYTPTTISTLNQTLKTELVQNVESQILKDFEFITKELNTNRTVAYFNYVMNSIVTSPVNFFTSKYAIAFNEYIKNSKVSKDKAYLLLPSMTNRLAIEEVNHECINKILQSTILKLPNPNSNLSRILESYTIYYMKALQSVINLKNWEKDSLHEISDYSLVRDKGERVLYPMKSIKKGDLKDIKPISTLRDIMVQNSDKNNPYMSQSTEANILMKKLGINLPDSELPTKVSTTHRTWMDDFKDNFFNAMVKFTSFVYFINLILINILTFALRVIQHLVNIVVSIMSSIPAMLRKLFSYISEIVFLIWNFIIWFIMRISSTFKIIWRRILFFINL